MRVSTLAFIIAVVAVAGVADRLESQETRTFAAAELASSDSSVRARDPGVPHRRITTADSTRTATRNPPARLPLASVVVSGKPGSLEVVAIPLPRELATADSVQFRVLPEAGVKLMGRTQGTLASATSRAKSLIVTVTAPSTALAGRRRVASALFDTPNGDVALEVPVEMTVLDVHRVELTLIDQMIGARRGDVVTIRYRAVNFGNVPDSVSIRVQTPDGWNVTGGVARSLRLGVRAAVDGAIRIWIPPQSAPGTQIVHIVASAAGAVVSAGDVRVEVENPYAAATHDGPRLDLGSAVTSLQNGPISQAYTASLQGNLSDSTTISAAGVWRTGNTAAASSSDLALLRLGVATLPASVALTSPHFRFGAGLTGGSLSELTGSYINGTGLSGGATVDGWTLSGTKARPYQYGTVTLPGVLRGEIDEARLERRVDSGTVFVMATHLDDPAAVRQLDAASVGAAYGGTPFGRLSSEFAYRKFADGDGLGWSGELDRQTDDGSLTVRALHAPGGNRAFARATDEIASSGNRRLMDWLGMAGGFWRTSDGSSTLGASSGAGWNAGPTFLMPGASISVQARGSSLDVGGSTGGFGDRETGLATTAELHRGAAFANASVTIGEIARSIGTPTATIVENGNNLDTRATLGTTLSSGSIQVDAGIQRYAGSAGMMPQQIMLGIRAEKLALPIGERYHVYVGGEIQRLAFSIGTVALSQRYNVTLPVGSWFEISAVAERNPFYTMGADGHLGWLTAIRIDRSIVLPRLVSPGHRYTIYRDANANGRRDRGEDGVAGIVVNCADRTVVTDVRGRFKCGPTEAFSIDARSIPIGWLAPSVTGVARTAADIGLTAMTSVPTYPLPEAGSTLTGCSRAPARKPI